MCLHDLYVVVVVVAKNKNKDWSQFQKYGKIIFFKVAANLKTVK